MPTPRLTSQIALQAGTSAPPGAENSDAWVGGLVVAVTGFINAKFQVYLDSNDYVFADSAIDAEIAVNSLVWVTRNGSSALIVAVQ